METILIALWSGLSPLIVWLIQRAITRRRTRKRMPRA